MLGTNPLDVPESKHTIVQISQVSITDTEQALGAAGRPPYLKADEPTCGQPWPHVPRQLLHRCP